MLLYTYHFTLQILQMEQRIHLSNDESDDKEQNEEANDEEDQGRSRHLIPHLIQHLIPGHLGPLEMIVRTVGETVDESNNKSLVNFHFCLLGWSDHSLMFMCVCI